MNKARTKGPFIIKNEDSLRKGACRQFMMIGKNVKRGFRKHSVCIFLVRKNLISRNIKQ